MSQSDRGTKRPATVFEEPAPTPRRRRAHWSESAAEALLAECREMAGEGGRGALGSFALETCDEISWRMAENGFDFDGDQIHRKFKSRSAMWDKWHKHCGRVSDWRRNEDDVPVNEEEIEDEYFTQHPEAKMFRRKAPPFREELSDLLDWHGTQNELGKYAVGVEKMLEWAEF